MVRERMAKKTKSLEADLISDLPREIIDAVMERLPLPDAARMCIISHKWLDIWTATPKLTFDNAFFSLHTRYRRETAAVQFRQNSISKILLHHKGPILKFSIDVPSSFGLPDVSHWIFYLSRMGVRDVSLQFEMCHRLHKLSSHLFFCSGLEKLKLRYCVLSPPPKFNGFRKLMFLELIHVTIKEDTFKGFIVSCPLLHTLILRNVSGIENLDIDEADINHLVVDGGTFKSLQFGSYRGFRKLTTLEFANVPLTDDGLRHLIFNFPLLETLCLRNIESLEHIFIDAPNIRHLVVDGTFQSLEVGDAPNLVSAFISLQKVLKINGMSNLCGLIKVLADSCEFKKLCLGGPFNKVFFKGFRLRKSFDSLTNLQLSSIQLNDLDDLSSVAKTIQCFRNIEMLYISVVNTSNENSFILKYSSAFILQNLRFAKVIFCSASSAEVKLVAFLLDSAPVLEKLYIDSNTISGPICISLLAELLRLPRASSKAEIIHLRNTSDVCGDSESLTETSSDDSSSSDSD